MWVIIDWTGKACFHGRRFKTFEDGWAFLYEKFDSLPEKEFDEEMGEYWVESCS